MAQQQGNRRSQLIEEGRRLVNEQEASGWRLAEIVHELRVDGLTYQAIADALGWKRPQTAMNYEGALWYRDTNTFSDAYLLGRTTEERRTALMAVAEAEGIALGTAKARPEVKAISAAIASLPEAEKEQVARELANDPGFMADALAEHGRQRTKDRRETPTHSPTPLEKAINTARLRIAISKAEQAAQTVLDGVTRDDLDADDVASLERSSHRARVLADYIDAVLGIGDLDAALEEMLS